jgi:hypothetical protein
MTYFNNTASKALYTIASDGTNMVAYSARGRTVTASTDVGAIVNTLIGLLPAAGGLIEWRNDGNVFPCSTAISLPKNVTNRLWLNGNESKIQLAASKTDPIFITWNRTNDNDTFQNTSITDFNIDVNNITGRGSVIGTYSAAGNGLQRVNFDSIDMRRIRMYNMLVDSTTTNHSIGVYIFTRHISASEATTNYVKNILMEDVRVEGGNIGFTLGGTGPISSIINIEYDNIEFVRCWHSLLVVPTVNYSSANFQVGVRSRGAGMRDASVPGTGGSVRMKDCFGEYSGDVGIEIDCPRDCVIDNCTMKDSFTNGFYTSNNQPLTNVEKQQWLFSNCTWIRRDTTQGTGFKATASEGNALGRYVIRNCQVHRNEPTAQNGGIDGFIFAGASTIPSIEEIDIDGFYIHSIGTNYDSTVAPTADVQNLIVINTWASTTVKTNVKIRNVRLIHSATRIGTAHSMFLTGIVLGGPMTIDIDRIDLDYRGTNISTSGITGVEVGAQAGSSIDGRIAHVRVRNTWTGETAPSVLKFFGTGTLTIPNGIDVEGCDFRSLLAGGSEVLFTSPSNAPKVNFRNNKWKTLTEFRTVATTYSALYPQDEIILGNAAGGAFTITLPDATLVAKNRPYTIKRINAGVNFVTVGTTSSQTIDGATTYDLTQQWQSINIVSDGSNWMIL